ncbi:MAG TPA: hypothetical protein VE685_13275 [Thermoanaerobaculia bacterium]|nr:hypothetical protein [Thermoanaerobaculia bacterium]
MRKTWMNLLAAVLLAAVVTVPAAAQSYPAANDGWKTPGGGQSTVDLSQYPNILGSPYVNPVVSLKGKPLSSQLGTIDTLLERGPVTLSGGTGTGTLRIVALSLESESPVQLQDGRSYRLNLTLSSTPSPNGFITLTKINQDGGTFSSSFDVLPKLTFINVFDSADVVNVDCASGGCPRLTMSSSNSAWVTKFGPSPGNFDPAAAGVTPIAAGINVQGYTTIGTNHAVVPGITPNRPSYTPAAINEEDLWARHRVDTPRDCLRTTTTTSASTTKALQTSSKLCAAVAEPTDPADPAEPTPADPANPSIE